MSAKRFNARCVMIVLLALFLLAAGCATTSSQAAKPHKPQMITDEVERDGLELPDSIAAVLEFLDFFMPREALGDPGISWR